MSISELPTTIRHAFTKIATNIDEDRKFTYLLYNSDSRRKLNVKRLNVNTQMVCS